MGDALSSPERFAIRMAKRWQRLADSVQELPKTLVLQVGRLVRPRNEVAAAPAPLPPLGLQPGEKVRV